MILTLRGRLLKRGTVKQGGAQGGSSPGQAAVGSLGRKAQWLETEAAADLLKSQRKGGLGDRFGDSPGMSCSCPLLRWLQVSRGPLEFTRCTPERGERRGRAWRGKRWQWVLKTLICYFSYIQLKFPPVLIFFFLAIFSPTLSIPDNYIASCQLLGWCS